MSVVTIARLCVAAKAAGMGNPTREQMEAFLRIADDDLCAIYGETVSPAPLDETTLGYYERQIDPDAVDPISKRLGLSKKP